MSSKKNWWVSGNFSSEDLGAIIKEVREDLLEISQEACAEQIGVKLNTLVSSEKGKGNHISNVLSRICDVYDLESSVTIKNK